MSNAQAVATLQPRQKSVTIDMADRFGMEADAFERTLRATVFPPDAPREEFAAFLLVAKQYNLNPILKEIYAYPKRGGGIVPIVSIDGWCNLINSNPHFDGMDFDETHNEKGDLVSIKCSIYRKDRSHPVSVTEYLTECVRPTEPWKMKHRMLRHKATIQCARYAFGLAGIYDEDEAERIIENAERTPRLVPPVPPTPPARQLATIEHKPAAEAPAAQDPAPAIVKPPTPPKPPAPAKSAPPIVDAQPTDVIDGEDIISNFQAAAEAARDEGTLEEAYAEYVKPLEGRLFPPDLEQCDRIYREALRRISG